MNMMPAGKYYVGDLCYVLDELWDEVCENLSEGEHKLSDGRKYVWYHTKYGDGMYTSNIGTNHPVDAGLIGCIELGDEVSEDYDFGAIVEFKNPFKHGSDEDGNIWFGHVLIPTGSFEEDFCDEEEWDDGEDYEGVLTDD